MIISSVKKDNTEIGYFSFGNGKKTLVILPGLDVRMITESAKNVENAYSRFKNDYTVYVIDRKTDIPNGYTIFDIADDTAYVMNELGLENADVFGASMGGMIAQVLTINYPKLVRSLILGSTVARCNDYALGVFKEWVSLAQKGDVHELAVAMINRLFSPKLASQLAVAVDMLFPDVTPEGLDRFIIQARMLLDFDVYDRLTEITCPVLVIGVEGDRVLTGEASVEIAAKLGCELYMYGAEYGHCVFDEAPGYKQRLLAFYSSFGN